MKGELCSQASAQVIRNPPTQWVLLITDIVMPAGEFVEGKIQLLADKCSALDFAGRLYYS